MWGGAPESGNELTNEKGEGEEEEEGVLSVAVTATSVQNDAKLDRL